jgi:hypothetical protein
MKKVYLSEYIAPSARRTLEKRCEVVDSFDHPEELDAIIVRRARVTKDIIDHSPKLKCISMHGVGTDTIDVAEAKKKGRPRRERARCECRVCRRARHCPHARRLEEDQVHRSGPPARRARPVRQAGHGGA